MIHHWITLRVTIDYSHDKVSKLRSDKKAKYKFQSMYLAGVNWFISVKCTEPYTFVSRIFVLGYSLGNCLSICCEFSDIASEIRWCEMDYEWFSLKLFWFGSNGGGTICAIFEVQSFHVALLPQRNLALLGDWWWYLIRFNVFLLHTTHEKEQEGKICRTVSWVYVFRVGEKLSLWALRP